MNASGTRSGLESRYLPIAEHAVIGNLRTAAFVGRNGSIDWCCRGSTAPVYSAASSMLGLRGHFGIAPQGGHRAEQAYIPETNVLQTTFETGEGRLRVTDWLPVRGDLEGKGQEDVPAEICRLVECLAGPCDMVLEWAPRFDYARAETDVRLSSGGAVAESASDRSTLRGLPDGGEVVRSQGGPLLRLKRRLVEGERFAVASAWGEPGLRYTVDDAYACRDQTVKAWQQWVERGRADESWTGEWRDMIGRSGLALKLLIHHPSSPSWRRRPPPSLKRSAAPGTGITATPGFVTPCRPQRLSTHSVIARMRETMSIGWSRPRAVRIRTS